LAIDSSGRLNLINASLPPAVDPPVDTFVIYPPSHSYERAPYGTPSLVGFSLPILPLSPPPYGSRTGNEGGGPRVLSPSYEREYGRGGGDRPPVISFSLRDRLAGGADLELVLMLVLYRLTPPPSLCLMLIAGEG
jgi:hypothetical protein